MENLATTISESKSAIPVAAATSRTQQAGVHGIGCGSTAYSPSYPDVTSDLSTHCHSRQYGSSKQYYASPGRTGLLQATQLNYRSARITTDRGIFATQARH